MSLLNYPDFCPEVGLVHPVVFASWQDERSGDGFMFGPWEMGGLWEATCLHQTSMKLDHSYFLIVDLMPMWVAKLSQRGPWIKAEKHDDGLLISWWDHRQMKGQFFWPKRHTSNPLALQALHQLMLHG